MTTVDRVSNEKKNLNRLAGEFLVASRLGYSDIVGRETRGMDGLAKPFSTAASESSPAVGRHNG